MYIAALEGSTRIEFGIYIDTCEYFILQPHLQLIQPTNNQRESSFQMEKFRAMWGEMDVAPKTRH